MTTGLFLPFARWGLWCGIVSALAAGLWPGSSAADERLVRALSSTARLVQNGSSGTVFFVELPPAAVDQPPRLALVTAAHVFESSPQNESRLILRRQQDDGSWARIEVPLVIRKEGQPLWTRHPDHDIAALPYTLPEGTAMRTFALADLAEETGPLADLVTVGQETWVPCFPATTEANPAGWPVLRRGSIASYPLRPTSAYPRLTMDISAFGGDSGAPVLIRREGGVAIVGLVLGMHRQTDRVVSPFEERVTHTPLGLSIVAQSPFIREVLVKLP